MRTCDCDYFRLRSLFRHSNLLHSNFLNLQPFINLSFLGFIKQFWIVGSADDNRTPIFTFTKGYECRMIGISFSKKFFHFQRSIANYTEDTEAIIKRKWSCCDKKQGVSIIFKFSSFPSCQNVYLSTFGRVQKKRLFMDNIVRHQSTN